MRGNIVYVWILWNNFIGKNLPGNTWQKHCSGKLSLEWLFQILVYKIWVEMGMLDEDMCGFLCKSSGLGAGTFKYFFLRAYNTSL